jgi:hypothetical protein
MFFFLCMPLKVTDYAFLCGSPHCSRPSKPLTTALNSYGRVNKQ